MTNTLSSCVLLDHCPNAHCSIYFLHYYFRFMRNRMVGNHSTPIQTITQRKICYELVNSCKNVNNHLVAGRTKDDFLLS